MMNSQLSIRTTHITNNKVYSNIKKEAKAIANDYKTTKKMLLINDELPSGHQNYSIFQHLSGDFDLWDLLYGIHKASE